MIWWAVFTLLESWIIRIYFSKLKRKCLLTGNLGERCLRKLKELIHQIQNKVSLKPWYNQFLWFSRKFIVLLNRIRIGHPGCEKHLNMYINVLNFPVGQMLNIAVGDIDHTLFNSNTIREEIDRLLYQLIRLEFRLPFFINNLLALNDRKVHCMLFAFIEHNNIDF